LLLLLLLMKMIILYNGNEYLHSMNSQLVIRGLNVFLKFDFLSCVSSTSWEEISVTFSRIYQTVFCAFLLWEGPNYFGVYIDESFENYNWSVIRNVWLSSLERLWFLEIKFANHGEYECLKNININLGNSSTLTFFPVTNTDEDDLCLKGFANINGWLSLSFPWKQLDFKPYNNADLMFFRPCIIV
jgi:hypothetical protein